MFVRPGAGVQFRGKGSRTRSLDHGPFPVTTPAGRHARDALEALVPCVQRPVSLSANTIRLLSKCRKCHREIVSAQISKVIATFPDDWIVNQVANHRVTEKSLRVF